MGRFYRGHVRLWLDPRGADLSWHFGLSGDVGNPEPWRPAVGGLSLGLVDSVHSFRCLSERVPLLFSGTGGYLRQLEIGSGVLLVGLGCRFLRQHFVDFSVQFINAEGYDTENICASGATSGSTESLQLPTALMILP
jgi:hypothetical protein